MSTKWFKLRLILKTLILTVLLAYCTEAKNNYQIRINSINCESIRNNTLLVSHVSCRLYNGGTSNSKLYYSLILAKDVNAFIIRIKFGLIKKNNALMTLVDTHLNGCSYFSDMSNSRLTEKYRKKIMCKSNLPKSCPLRAHKLFELRNLTINSDDFPPGAPKCKWTLTLEVLYNNVTEIKSVLNGITI